MRENKKTSKKFVSRIKFLQLEYDKSQLLPQGGKFDNNDDLDDAQKICITFNKGPELDYEMINDNDIRFQRLFIFYKVK